jgi:hypothetical protein
VNAYDWGLYPEAEARLRGLLREFIDGSGRGKELALRIEDGTSTDIFEWVDHIAVPSSPFSDFPFLRQAFTAGEKWFPLPESAHPPRMLPD